MRDSLHQPYFFVDRAVDGPLCISPVGIPFGFVDGRETKVADAEARQNALCDAERFEEAEVNRLLTVFLARESRNSRRPRLIAFV